jgi:hypothetical protein
VILACPVRERFKVEALKCFLEAQQTPLRTDSGAFSTYLQTLNHRTLYPCAVNVDLNRKKEEFDDAYRDPVFHKSLKDEFLMKAQAGQLDSAAAVVMGTTLAVSVPHAAGSMRKRVNRLMEIWIREPPSTQGERHSFFKAAELPEQSLLLASLGVSQLSVPLFPFHTLTQAKNNELLMIAPSVHGGGTHQTKLLAKGLCFAP